MNIASLFQRKRAIKAEAEKPLQEQYIDIVRSLARGDEIDEQEIFQVIDALNITEQQLSKDVDTQQKRFDLGMQLQKRDQAIDDVAALNRDCERLDAEYQKFMASWQPKRTTAFNNLRAAEVVLLQTSNVEAKLVETCLDPSLLERGKGLDSRRNKLGFAIRELEDEVARCRGRISHARAMVEQVDIDNSRLPGAFIDGHQKTRDKFKAHQVELAKKSLADEERSARPTLERYEKLKADLSEVDAQIRELNKEKLIP